MTVGGGGIRFGSSTAWAPRLMAVERPSAEQIELRGAASFTEHDCGHRRARRLPGRRWCWAGSCGALLRWARAASIT